MVFDCVSDGVGTVTVGISGCVEIAAEVSVGDIPTCVADAGFTGGRDVTEHPELNNNARVRIKRTLDIIIYS
jgi:hypothetical protein